MSETLQSKPNRVTDANPSSAIGSTATQPSAFLSRKLQALRQRHLTVETAKGVAVSVIVCLELLALLLFADWCLDFPWGVRLALFLVQFGVFNAILYRYVFVPWFRPPDDEELALRVEHTYQELNSRLISSVQFGRPGSLSPGGSIRLAAATMEQTEAMAARLDFLRVVPLDSLKTLAAIAISVLLLGSAGFYVSRAVSVDLLRRAFLADVPVPRKTRIDYITGDLTIGRGDSVHIEALANGFVPPQGTLTVKMAGKKDQVYPMDPMAEQKGRFFRGLENIQDDFQYTVRLYDSQSPVYTIHVVSRPAINHVECEQVPPAYTHWKSQKRSPGDLSLLAGSRLKFKATATKELKSATLRLFGSGEKRQRLDIPTSDRTEISGEFAIPAKGLTGFGFELMDLIGMKSPEGTVYRVDIVPDKPPQTKLTWPERKEELITRLATLVIGLDVLDDFAIQKVALKYKVNTVDSGAEKVLELSLPEGETNRVRRRFEWKIGSFQPPISEGSLIEYWIEAQDNNNVTGPGIGASEHQIARVVSENEKRADLLNRAGDSIGVLGDVTSDQEKLNRNLGTLILEKTGAR